MRNVLLTLSLLAGLVACSSSTVNDGASYDKLSRADFNRLAVRQNLPLYWVADADHDQAIDPAEVVTLLYYPTATAWTDGDRFTAAFGDAYASLVAASTAPVTDARLALVAKELDQGAPTLVDSDLTKLTVAEKDFVGHMMTIGDLIDDLFDRTTGAAALAAQVPADPLSQSLFRRNRGPQCQAAATADDPTCSAIPGTPKLVVDLYPAALQSDENFCAALEERSDADKLLDPFTVVRGSGQDLEAIPYTEAYPSEMTAIADELDIAAGLVTDPAEEALGTYLRAAAASFRSNDWEPADEAWSAMSAENSKWYVRVGPDETYSDPCGHKAAFHLTFARINQASLEWQNRLAPVRQDMENALAALTGAKYQPRNVSFHLPDFIDIIVNTGDDRFAFGVTTGQSLPNWGRVADENRRRTVVMTNVTTDADSLATRRIQAASLIDATSLTDFVDSPEPDLFSTILHEATHNFGPGSSYTVDGQSSDEVFGGSLSAMLEELKAQTGALYYIEFLRDRGIIDDTLAAQTYASSIVWALGSIPFGATGTDAQPYAQLSAIQIGFLLDQGALSWDPTAMAANGVDKGAFTIHYDKLVASIDNLMALVTTIKTQGDKAGAEKLVAMYAVDTVALLGTITERWQRVPQPSFVYTLAI